MYQLIAKHTPVLQLYIEKLKEEKILNDDELNTILKTINDEFQKSFEASKNYSEQSTIRKAYLDNFENKTEVFEMKTGVDEIELKEYGKKCNTLPEDFNAHPQVKKFYKNRLASIESGTGID